MEIQTDRADKKISLVIPVYRESKNIEAVYRAIADIFKNEKLLSYRWCIVFVDDGSPDDSWKCIRDLYRLDPVHVSALRFSRNFGKETALSAGVKSSSDADAVICLDADMQHPPSLIPEFIEEWENGAQVVIGIRKKVADYGIVKSIGSKLFYKIMNYFSEIKIESQSTDFRLLDKKVVSAFRQFSEKASMFRGLVDWLGFDRAYISFEAPERAGGGRPSYSFKKLARLAIDSIVSFSWLPLRITGYMGAFVILASSLILLIMAFTHIFHLAFYTIQAYFIVLITFLVGMILSAIGFLALYIEQIHRQVQNRPLYVVYESIGDINIKNDDF